MKRILFILLMIWSVAQAQTAPSNYTNINSRYQWLAGRFKSLALPAGDTAFASGEWPIAGSVKYDSTKASGFRFWVWNGSAWENVGSGGSNASIYYNDGTIDSIRTVTIPYGTRISWRANGAGYGLDSQKPPYWHYSLNDTIANNTYSSAGGAAIWERNALFTTSRRQYHKGFDFINRWMTSDSTRLESVGGDYAYGLRSERVMTRESSDDTRSVWAGPSSNDWDAAPNLIAWDVHKRPTGHSASQRSRGWWAGISSYLYMEPVLDTVDGWIGFIDMSRLTSSNKVNKYIGYWAGGGWYSDGRVDSVFGFYSRYAGVRNHFAGPTGFGLNNTGATANVDILGTMRLREGNQGDGKVLTSDANGWATWQTPAASGLFGRSDARNSTGSSLAFSNAGQDYLIDSIANETRNYIANSGRTGSFAAYGNGLSYETANGSIVTGISADGSAGIQLYHGRNSDGRNLGFQITNDATFRLYYGGGYSLKASSLTASMRFLARDTITGNVYDYTGSLSGGTSNTNAGSGYRWLKPAGQEIKTVFGGGVVSLDSAANTDALTVYANEENYEAYAALGGGVKAAAIDILPTQATSAATFTDSQLRIVALFINKPQTLTGVKLWVRTQGSYTGDQNNKVGLYSYSGGTLTLVASSTNDADLWKASANTYQSIPFSSTYAATPGIYFVATLWNASSTTTAPAFGGVTLTNAAMADLGFSNSAKLYGLVNTQGDLPSTLAMSSVTAAISPAWVGVY